MGKAYYPWGKPAPKIDAGEERVATKLRQQKRQDDLRRTWERNIAANNRELATFGPPKPPPKRVYPDELVINGAKYKPDPRDRRKWVPELELDMDRQRKAKAALQDMITDIRAKEWALRKSAMLMALGPAGNLTEVAGHVTALVRFFMSANQMWDPARTTAPDSATWVCAAGAGPPWGFSTFTYNTLPDINLLGCLSGQPQGAGGYWDGFNEMARLRRNTIMMGRHTNPSTRRGIISHCYWSPISAQAVSTRWWAGPMANPEPNPNYTRLTKPADRTQSVTRAPSPGKFPQIAYVVTVGPKGAGAPPPTIAATATARPSAGVKERKGRALQAVFAVLDGVSEAGEVVDCVYKSLPKDVQKRWEKGRPKPPRGHLSNDQHGQYGTEGAEWKLQAVWHNSHKIDLNAAVTCIAKNHLEDKVIGAAQRGKARMTGQNTFGKGGAQQWASRIAGK